MSPTMNLFLTLLLVSVASAQVDPSVIDSIFGPPPGMSSTTVAGAPNFMGSDGTGSGDCICVPYHNCDENRVLRLDGETDGFGIIDIRFGKTKCKHFLDLCCTYPPPLNGDDNQGSTANPNDPNKPPVTFAPPPETPPPTLPPTEVIKCGQRNKNGVEFNIAGNNDREAEYGEFPWMVAILRTNWVPGSDDNLAVCGGSLIHPQVVLTGAHCVQNLHPTDIKIRAGEWDTQTTKERYPYQEEDVDSIIVHKDFQPKVLLNDVALLVLKNPVKYAANVKPICLPPKTAVFDQSECFVSGWGKDIFGKEGRPSLILKKIDLPMVQQNKCESLLKKTRLGAHFQLHKSFVCAGGVKGKDACTGDGGGPLVCPDKNNPNRYSQAGIVAWGIGCGDQDVPGVYANVALFRDWIDDQMRLLKFDTTSYTQ